MTYRATPDYIIGELGRKMKWARLTWFPEHGIENIHQDDIEKLKPGIQGLVGIIEESGKVWETLNCGVITLRVKKCLLTRCSKPKFIFDESVTTLSPRTIKSGTINCISWHFKDNAPTYHLKVNGRQIKSWYKTKELKGSEQRDRE